VVSGNISPVKAFDAVCASKDDCNGARPLLPEPVPPQAVAFAGCILALALLQALAGPEEDPKCNSKPESNAAPNNVVRFRWDIMVIDIDINKKKLSPFKNFDSFARDKCGPVNYMNKMKFSPFNNVEASARKTRFPLNEKDKNELSLLVVPDLDPYRDVMIVMNELANIIRALVPEVHGDGTSAEDDRFEEGVIPDPQQDGEPSLVELIEYGDDLMADEETIG
jgi:hypothetical protein